MGYLLSLSIWHSYSEASRRKEEREYVETQGSYIKEMTAEYRGVHWFFSLHISVD